MPLGKSAMAMDFSTMFPSVRKFCPSFFFGPMVQLEKEFSGCGWRKWHVFV